MSEVSVFVDAVQRFGPWVGVVMVLGWLARLVIHRGFTFELKARVPPPETIRRNKVERPLPARR